MTGSIIVNGSNVTLRFDYTTTQTIALAVAGSAAKELFSRGLGNHGTETAPRNEADLSNQEMVNLIDAYILRLVNALAQEYEGDKAANKARADTIAATAKL